jgi:hypothetical protein
MTAAESDLRGEVALAIMALMTWAEFHGGLSPLIDGTVERFINAGKPDAGISRAITNTRRAIARYLEHGGRAPEWLPASVLTLLKEPVANPQFDSLPTNAPSTNPTRTRTPDTKPAPSGPDNERK